MTQMVARWNSLTYHTFRICYALTFKFCNRIRNSNEKNRISNFMFYKNLIVNVFFSLSESIFQSFHFLFRTTLSILITSMSLLLKAVQDCIKKYQQTELWLWDQTQVLLQVQHISAEMLCCVATPTVFTHTPHNLQICLPETQSRHSGGDCLFFFFMSLNVTITPCTEWNATPLVFQL